METAKPDQEKWKQYPNTVLEFSTAPALRIDLRKPVESEAVEGLRAIGLTGPFAVLTAENPCGENVEDAPTDRQADAREERNERRTGRLEAELLRRGTTFARVDGVSPDGSYREHCLAILLPEDQAVELAKQLDQLALFWFDGEAFWLLPAEADQAPTRLPRAPGDRA
ncbi:MAG TPA: DUF3293 domain-containing protein [Gemmatimonadaceae bacterium]|nr:DUF3293 domain-containing protein [Gemmatimonadaceae bacterium]